MTRQKQNTDDNVYYVYGHVQTRASKKKEILREYGYEIRRQEEEAAKRVGSRPFGSEFADEQRRRARPHPSARDRAGRTDGGGYIYRPGRVTGREGGARVAVIEKTPHFKLVLDKIVNFFDSVEERAKQDEGLMKRRAVMEKRWSENKNNIIIALVLVLLSAVIMFGVYRLFFVVRNIYAVGSDIYSADELAKASGIENGDTLYSFSASDIENVITFSCPYLKEADVSRSVPNTVNIFVEDDTPVYSASIWGDVLELSAGLKVLGRTTAEEAAEKGLITLVLPPVQYSVAGRAVGFADAKNERFVRSILDEMMTAAEVHGNVITLIDLTDEYDIKMEASGLYSLKIGGEDGLDLKLRMFYRTISSGSLDKALHASIDLTTVGEACVRYDF